MTVIDPATSPYGRSFQRLVEAALLAHAEEMTAITQRITLRDQVIHAQAAQIARLQERVSELAVLVDRLTPAREGAR